MEGQRGLSRYSGFAVARSTRNACFGVTSQPPTRKPDSGEASRRFREAHGKVPGWLGPLPPLASTGLSIIKITADPTGHVPPPITAMKRRQRPISTAPSSVPSVAPEPTLPFMDPTGPSVPSAMRLALLIHLRAADVAPVVIHGRLNEVTGRAPQLPVTTTR